MKASECLRGPVGNLGVCISSMPANMPKLISHIRNIQNLTIFGTFRSGIAILVSRLRCSRWVLGQLFVLQISAKRVILIDKPDP